MSDPIPLVSFVVPAHNHAAFVEAALHSIVAQSYPRIELIVIDDGSCDTTAEIVARTLARITRPMRVEFRRQPHQGLGSTLAHALTLAQGEFVQFLASDDALFPEMTARLVAEFGHVGPEVAAISCDGYVFDDRGGPHVPFSQLHPQPFSRNQHQELMVANWFPAMGLLYRLEAVMESGGPDPDMAYEDWGLLLKLTRKYRIARIPDRLFVYRQHGRNASADPDRMRSALQALTARYPAMAGARDLRAALTARDLRGSLARLTPRNIGQALRFVLRRIQARIAGMRPPFRARLPKGRAVQPGVGRVDIGPGCTIHPSARLEVGPGPLTLGAGCHIGARARLIAGPGLTIGAGTFVEAGAQIGGPERQTDLGRGCLIAAGTRVEAGSTLGDRCVTPPHSRVGGAHPKGRWLLPGAECHMTATLPEETG